MPTPLLHTIDPVAFSVRDGWRGRHECRLDRSALNWDDHRLPYAEIVAVAYSSTRRAYNLVQRRVERRVRLTTRRGELDVRIGVHAFGPSLAPQQQDVYRIIITTLHALVEPRLRAQLLRAVAAGDTVDVGTLRISASHLENLDSGDKVEWRQLPSAQLDEDRVVVRAAIERDQRLVATLPMLTPNAPLLPELLDEAAITFS